MTQKEIYFANLAEKRKRGLKSVGITTSQIINAADLIREECSKLSPQEKVDLDASARKFIVEQ